jgi:UDP-3-O-[3-hydroxymyristoyl] glucosamine N-acyltransferase
LSQWLRGELLGAGDRVVDRIAPLESADARSISFLAHGRYEALLGSTRAACVIVGPAHREAALALPSAIVCADPYHAFARLTQWWAAAAPRSNVEAGIHPSAFVDPAAELDVSVSIGPFAVIGAGACVGPGTRIGAHAVIEASATLGADCRIAARVFVGAGCRVGDRCIAHPGVVIGADGFGFAPHQGAWEKIEQLGAVSIGHDVEIGANTCIDRGALDDTVIGDGVKLDNLIQVGHNVHIGDHSAMAGCVGIAGSAQIGAHCTVGGGAIILGHLELADHVHISAATVVTRSILQPGHYSGVFPFDDNASWEKNAATLRQLHRMRERLRALERRSS